MQATFIFKYLPYKKYFTLVFVIVCQFTRKKSEKNSIEKPETYIYINTSNQVQFPLVLDIMKKLHANVPKDIETLVKVNCFL